MNENATAQETAEVSQSADRSVNASTSSRVTVNFFIPEGVDPANLTLENYREVTTKRFRMTKDQFVTRGLSRKEAFVESKALAISQLGVSDE